MNMNRAVSAAALMGSEGNASGVVVSIKEVGSSKDYSVNVATILVGDIKRSVVEKGVEFFFPPHSDLSNK